MSREAEIHRLIRVRLAEVGQIYTGNRRELVDALIEVGRPVTLPELLDRNLAVLAEIGIVRRLTIGDDHIRFEIHEDLAGHHHHLVCDECGTVADVTLPEHVERDMDTGFDAVAEAAGFSVTGHNVDIHGLCADCRA
ncbi:MAG: Fur family transcriptional regulator [Ilumatobacteraceae bacterium]